MSERITSEIRTVDALGMLHRILEYTIIVDGGAAGDAEAIPAGTIRFSPEDGRTVIPRGDGFEFVATGAILTRP